MQQSPLTDKDFGFIIDHETKFADIRHKALKEYINRKVKRKKDKITPVPEVSPGKQIITTQSGYRSDTQYYLYEVIDFCLNYHDSFEYFGILLKTTDKRHLDRIGRIDSFSAGHNWSLSKKITKITSDKIKWLEEK